MAERAEFVLGRVQPLVFGLVFLGLAGLFAVGLLPAGLPDLAGDTVFLLLVIAAMAAADLWFLARLRLTGVVVVVDVQGITALRLMPDPILWS